jgi:effector-binding domain-containing protein
MLRTFLVALLMLAGSAAMAADEPEHTTILRQGAIEIRDYAPMIMAEVEVGGGSMGRASNAGFRPLANFIFGDNTAPQGGSDEIAMTTPVTQRRSQEIAMTTPVTQQAQDGNWRVGFVMPADSTMETLPRPNDPRVAISEVPARRMAVIRFNGGPSDRRFMAKQAELMAWLDENGYAPVGEPVYARYDPPWVPTPFRRNEVMVEVAAR